jgi:hypothetical protein
MKKLYSFVVLAFLAGGLFAQTDFTLEINHKLGVSPFQMNTSAVNNNSVPFKVTRLQYYIGQITLIHDGAQETTIPNTWFLINASNAFQVSLGSHSITTLEGVRFGVGVEQSANHLDPSSYAASHPLAPKSPSMHWGWSAGYRFVAMEGKSGANFSQTYEIHALDDSYYYLTTVNTAGFAGSNGITIALDADYAMALKNIDVSTGPITHGGFGESIALLQNFRDDVFTPSTTVGLEAGLSQEEFVLAPNPVSASGMVRIEGEFGNEAVVSVTDLSGRVIREQIVNGESAMLEVNSAGYYLVSLKKEGKTVATRKLIVTK